MAKAQKTPVRHQKKQAAESGLSTFNLDKIIPHRFHTAAAAILVILIFLLFFSPLYFGGKTFQSGDIVTSTSYTTFVKTYSFPLWNPYVFGGFPTAATVSSLRWFDFISAGYGMAGKVFGFVFSTDYAGYTFHLLILALTMFFLMKNLKATTWVSLLTSLAVVFSTGIIVFLYIGHVSKLPALAMYPMIFLLLLRFQKKIRILEILLMIVSLHLLVITLHVQMIFYLGLAVLIYFLYYIIRTLLKKENELLKKVFYSGLIFAGSLLIAVFMSYDEISQVYEYTPYSTRGSESITEKTTGVSEESGSGFYDYHTNWSFSPGEVLTFIVPSYYGFGNVTYKGPLTQEQEVEVQTYFGQMPFVDVPMYMGVVIFFLALYGIYARRKEAFVQFLAILAGISLLISFGKTFPVLFNLMFYNFPFFNKFRVPSMILVIVQVSMPILAGLAVMKIIDDRNNNELRGTKLLRNIFLAFAGLFILALLLTTPIKDWFISHIQDSGAKGQRFLQMQLGEFMSDMFHSDLLFAFGLTALAFGAAYMLMRNKLSTHLFVISIIFLVLVDLLRIDGRAAHYVDVPALKGIFDTPAYVNAIKNQNDKEPFRILNIKQDGSTGSLNQNQNYYAYFLLEDLFGYSGIKPRAYQDIMDVVGTPVNPTLWRMLNTKYIIADKPVSSPGFRQVYSDNKTFVYDFQGALPRAYFVNRTEKKSGTEILNDVRDNKFDPADVAFTEELVNADKPDSSAYVRIENYENEKLNLDVNATGNNFLFFGNTFYPVGWKASIDGKGAEIKKANHGYMGIIVPAGRHKVEFNYHPDSFYLGKYLALILSSLTLIALVAVVLLNTRKKAKV